MRGAGPAAARAHCPVCCGDLESELVYCARCSTPHHDECWQFTGRCAIYACTSEQFTRTEEAGGEEPVVVEDGAEPQGSPSAMPPAVAEQHPVLELAQSKRAAFRSWLRDLLDEGLRVPRLWTSAPLVQRRMYLPDREHEVASSAETRFLAVMLLALLPFILVIVLLGEPGWWALFEVGCYLGLTGFLYFVVAQPVRRQLIVDSSQGVVLEVTGDPLSARRQQLANLRGVAAVALLVERDPTSGLAPGVVLLDFERRPIALPGLELKDQRDGVPVDEDVRRARATARFLGLSFAGLVDGRGRRRRLPASDGTAPRS